MRKRKRSRLPQYVTVFKDRHGKPHYRFRRKGHKTYYFKAEFNSPEFHAGIRRLSQTG